MGGSVTGTAAVARRREELEELEDLDELDELDELEELDERVDVGATAVVLRTGFCTTTTGTGVGAEGGPVTEEEEEEEEEEVGVMMVDVAGVGDVVARVALVGLAKEDGGEGARGKMKATGDTRLEEGWSVVVDGTGEEDRLDSVGLGWMWTNGRAATTVAEALRAMVGVVDGDTSCSARSTNSFGSSGSSGSSGCSVGSSNPAFFFFRMHLGVWSREVVLPSSGSKSSPKWSGDFGVSDWSDWSDWSE